jgi:hypothetical protein
MIGSRFVTGSLLAVLTLVASAHAVVFAHDVLYPGTVLGVEAERLHVKTVDTESKKELNLWFAVTRDTRVKRGDRILTYAEAKIAKDERIVVVVNHDAEVKNVATELRLAATSGVGAVSEALVPVFLDAGIPGLKGFVCTMRNARWVQRGEAVANPYLGKAMPTCGVPIKGGA